MQASLRAASNYQYYGDYGSLDCTVRHLEVPSGDHIAAPTNHHLHLPLQSSTTTETTHSTVRDGSADPFDRHLQRQQTISTATPSQHQQVTACYNERLSSDESASNEQHQLIVLDGYQEHQQSEPQYDDSRHHHHHGHHDNSAATADDSIYLVQAANSLPASCEQTLVVAHSQTNHPYHHQTTIYYEPTGFGQGSCSHETLEQQRLYQHQTTNQQLISAFQAPHHESAAVNAYFRQHDHHQQVNDKLPQYHYHLHQPENLPQQAIATGGHQQQQHQQSGTYLAQSVGEGQQQQHSNQLQISYLEPKISASSALEPANCQQPQYDYHHHLQFEPIKADYHQLGQQEQVICYASAESKGASLGNSTQESLSSVASNASNENEDEGDQDDDDFSEESSSIASSLTRDEKRAREANIPLSYGEIVNLSIDQFNEQLVKHNLSESQLTLIKDIRRRGKNKVAAQSCRKRKMEQIYELQQEVNDLANRRRALSCESAQLVKDHGNLVHEYDRIYSIIQDRMLLD